MAPEVGHISKKGFGGAREAKPIGR